MEIIGLILLFLLFSWIWAIVDSIKQKKHDKEMARSVGPTLEKALSELEDSATDINLINERLKKLNNFFEKNKIVLKNENDKVINICPKCGDTLTVKTEKHRGRIIYCPNHTECNYLTKKVEDIKEGSFHNIHF